MNVYKINSAQRINNPTSFRSPTTTANFSFRVPKNINGIWGLGDIRIPNSSNNVTAYNNRIYFHDTTDRVAIVPPGIYTATTLATAIQTAMNAVAAPSNTYTVTNTAATPTTPNNITVVSDTTTFQFTFGYVSPISNILPLNSMANIMGFPPANTALAMSITSPYPINLSYLMSYNVVFNSTNNLITDTSANSYTWVIPVLAGAYTYYSPPYYWEQKVNLYGKSGLIVEVSLQDDNGNILDLNDVDWYCTIKKITDALLPQRLPSSIVETEPYAY